jgi:hypothetical protein
MTKTEIARIKKMLIGPLGKRLDRANAAQADLPRHLQNKDSRRDASRALAAAFDRSTVKMFEEIARRDQARLEARLKKIKAEAVRGSRDRQRTLSAAAAQVLNQWQAIAQVPLDESQIGHVLLNVPFVISANSSVELEQFQIIENKSFAKFRTRVDDGDDFFGDVRFSYVWTNPKNAFEVINVAAFVIFNGHCSLGVGGGLFPGDRQASVSVEGRLDILEFFNDPPTSPPVQADQKVTVLRMRETAFGFSEVGAVDARDIFRGVGLTHINMVVPPLATIVFVVAAAVSCGTGEDSGLAEADFASGAFQVSSPAVLLATLT